MEELQLERDNFECLYNDSYRKLLKAEKETEQQTFFLRRAQQELSEKDMETQNLIDEQQNEVKSYENTIQ